MNNFKNVISTLSTSFKGSNPVNCITVIACTAISGIVALTLSDSSNTEENITDDTLNQ